MSDTDRATTMSEQVDELNQNVRELRDEALLKPLATILNSVGVETKDIDETSENISIIDNVAAWFVGPVLASKGVVLGFYIGMQMTNSPDIALTGSIVTGLLFGATGWLMGVRYLSSDT